MSIERKEVSLNVAFRAAGLFGSVLLASTALAQAAPGFSLDRFDPAERGSSWFELDSLDLRGNVRGAAGLTLDWGALPLAAYGSDGSRVALVQNQLFAHLGGSLVLSNRLRLGVNLPVALYANGSTADIDGTTYGGPAAQALGDLRLAADVRLFGTSVDPFTLAIGAQVFAPTGNQGAYAGDGSARVVGHLQGAGQIGWFAYAFKLGWEWRSKSQLIDETQIGSEIQGGLALGVKLAHDALTIGPEVYGATTAWSSSTLFVGNSTPVEGVLGAHCQIGDFKLGAAVGPGLTRALGSPEVRTLVSFEWAPLPGSPERDRDGDGIPDAEDACPDVPGLRTSDPKTNGCPPVVVAVADRDHDGIPDSDDACPDVPGIRTDDPDTNGCPPPTPPSDRDHDGVPDAEDACPDVPGVKTDDPKTNGCPPPKQLVLVTKERIELNDKVYFDTGKSTIQERSFELLDQAAAAIAAHPEITRIVVDGHTDSVGKASSNRKLSEARAQAVCDYLTSKGVASERLEAHGYGPDKPIDTNATAAGRANNRRVEFRILSTDKPSDADKVTDPDATTSPSP